MAGRPIMIEVVVDDDDVTMAALDVRRRMAELGCTVTSGKHRSKIEAVNGGRVVDWDIIVLASDDMVPAVPGWAYHIERDMLKHFPQLDGALHYNDGHTADKLCTLPVQGRRLYDQFGVIYATAYRSLWCDNEQTEVLRTMDRLAYIPTCIIKHQHPVTTIGVEHDALYARNEALYQTDRITYEERKARGFDMPKMRLSILIATLPARNTMLQRMLGHVWKQALRRPREVEVLIDAGGGTTGSKRQRLLGRSRGEFIAFVDDDDRIADDYVDRILSAIDAVPAADCVEFSVEMKSNGTIFKGHCSIEYMEWSMVDGVYVRCPNHLSPVRRALALKAGFPDKTIGEDYDYSMRLRPHLKVQAPTSSEPLYFYYPGCSA